MASPVPVDNTIQLQITDLAEVLQLLKRHGYSGTSYYNLGLFLGLSSATLDAIKENEKNVENCLRECLTKWLQKADDGVEKNGGPTIYSLVSALRKLQENKVAEKVDTEKHPACKILAHYSAQQSLLTALPQLILLLHTAKLIKEMILPTNIQGEALLIQIKEAVCCDYQILKAFAEILCKAAATAEIGNTIIKEYREVYHSDDFIQANDANGLKIYLPMNVFSQFQSMRLKMGQTFFKVGSIMMNSPQSPTLDNIKYVLGTYDKTLRPQVAHCQDIHSILELVSDSCQLDDINVLEFFVNEFNIKEAMPVIQKYKEDIEELKKTNLSQYLNETFSNASPLECERITIFVDEDANQSVLNDVKRLSSAVFKDLSQHVRLNVIRDDNSFTITCSFPLILSEQLITTALNNIDVLKENKVKRLTIGYCTVYEVNDTSTPTKCGLMKQLMLSLSVQLINSKEEVNAFKGRLSESEKMKEQLEKKLRQKEEDMQQEKAKSKKEIELLNQKIATINEQLIEKDTQLQEKELKLRKSPQDKNPLIFEDDIYGDIIIDHSLIIKIVQTCQFQRLKDIKVLGYTYQNMPRATYSRLQHSIGMYYIAGEYVERIRKNQPELSITESDVLCVQIAALCYNLGHGPFSHTFGLFLDEICIRDKVNKPWQNVSEASVKMFEYMLEDNEDLMASFGKFFDDPEKDIAFIKELIQGTGFKQRKDKRFLYEIVYNKRSGLGVSIIDSTVRDAAVLGKNFTFRRRVFFNKAHILKCNDGEFHTCFPQDDLETHNFLFRTRQALFRELYYERKNRIAALIIKRILVKSNEIQLIKDKSRRVTIFEATKSMSAYTQLDDSILNIIKYFVDDKEVQSLLKCLDTMKVIGQIGYVTPTHKWNEDRIKQHIVLNIKSTDISDQLIIDPIMNGYENEASLTQYYYTSDGSTGQWEKDWAQPPPYTNTNLRIFLVSGDRNLIKEVQEALQELKNNVPLHGSIYPDEQNIDLMPLLKEDGANVLASV